MGTILKCNPDNLFAARTQTAPRRSAPAFRFAWLLVLFGTLAGCARRDAVGVYPYVHPLTSPGAKFAGLPPAVQSTVRAQAGAAEMYDIRKAGFPDQDAYEIIFRNRDRFPPLYVAADGSVLYPDLTVAVPANSNTIGATSGGAENGVSFSDLPINVAKTIHDKAPTAEVAFINKITVADKTFFQVTFKNPGQHPAMLLSEDGVVTNKLSE